MSTENNRAESKKQYVNPRSRSSKKDAESRK